MTYSTGRLFKIRLGGYGRAGIALVYTTVLAVVPSTLSAEVAGKRTTRSMFITNILITRILSRVFLSAEVRRV
ncbi:hypothetical protein AGOR_G00216080 [Albula goreensis]|uniref:Uncharacterized protein n=1 Tax=Albula goreensis TaxID=1534307 RepID=A0A8T3CIU7_9TELE|nr:hypothetical protein AGOR_G00216080 [Albula goreensis]